MHLTHFSFQTGENIQLQLVNTSITNLKSKWLVDALPDAVHAQLLMIDSRRALQLDRDSLQTLDERWSDIKLVQVQELELQCDCSVEPLWRMARNRLLTAANRASSLVNGDNPVDNRFDNSSMDHSTDPLPLIDADYRSSLIENYLNLTCAGPSSLAGYRLVDLELNEFICGADENLISASSHVVSGGQLHNSSTGSGESGVGDSSNDRTAEDNLAGRADADARSKLVRNTESGLASWSTSGPDASTHDYNYELANPSSNHKTLANRQISPTSRRPNPRHLLPSHRQSIHNDIDSSDRQLVRPVTFTKVDTLIIGIAAAIVAFVGILMLLVCVLKSKRTTSGGHLQPLDAAMYASHHHHFPPFSPLRTPSLTESCTCIKPASPVAGTTFVGPSLSGAASVYNLTPPSATSAYTYTTGGTMRAAMLPFKR